MSINPPTVNDLGIIVTSARLRRIIYSTYVVSLIAAGATQIAFAALEFGQPKWLVAALAVLAYLGIPVATLAVANTSPRPVASDPTTTGGD